MQKITKRAFYLLQASYLSKKTNTICDWVAREFINAANDVFDDILVCNDKVSAESKKDRKYFDKRLKVNSFLMNNIAKKNERDQIITIISMAIDSGLKVEQACSYVAAEYAYILPLKHIDQEGLQELNKGRNFEEVVFPKEAASLNKYYNRNKTNFSFNRTLFFLALASNRKKIIEIIESKRQDLDIKELDLLLREYDKFIANADECKKVIRRRSQVFAGAFYGEEKDKKLIEATYPPVIYSSFI